MNTLFIHRNTNWKDTPRSVLMAMILLIGYFLSSGIAWSQEGEASKDLRSVKAVIDFRTGDPKKALIYLTLIGDTFRDRNIRTATAHPDFVVNFGGESVKLLAKDMKGYSPEEQKTIRQIKDKVSALAKEGMKFEYCIYGGKLFGVEPANVQGVNVVDNGWVTVIGYQASGYSLVPAY
jgi:intracellular sulfur oxidation DsrE/DsrF family protein